MKTLKFKTNINCSGCVAKATPHLNEEKSIEKWEVNTQTADKVLTVEGENLDKEKVKEVVEKAGFIIKGEL
ncbi:MAG: cation transporter [Cytophagaceae bacterium]|nr:cation transporter [Cytophagaceae bacterium]